MTTRMFKIIVVGPSGVGKSSIILRFCNNTFVDTHNSTIGVDFYNKQIKYDDVLVAVQIWDTAGQEKYQCMTSNFSRNANGILAVYDVENKHSLNQLNEILPSYMKDADENVIVIVVGSRDDNSQGSADEKIRINSNEFEHHCCSAKTGRGIDSLFERIIGELLKAGISGIQINQEETETIAKKKEKERKGGCC